MVFFQSFFRISESITGYTFSIISERHNVSWTKLLKLPKFLKSGRWDWTIIHSVDSPAFYTVLPPLTNKTPFLIVCHHFMFQATQKNNKTFTGLLTILYTDDCQYWYYTHSKRFNDCESLPLTGALLMLVCLTCFCMCGRVQNLAQLFLWRRQIHNCQSSQHSSVMLSFFYSIYT